CVDLSGAPVSDGAYEPDSGTVRFTIRATDTYRIQAAPVPPALPPVSAAASVVTPAADLPAEPIASDAPSASEPTSGSEAPERTVPAAKAPENSVPVAEAVPAAPPPAESRGWLWLLPAGLLLSVAVAVLLIRRQRHE
ncbi:MAG: hypothetical protein RR197_06040, partial [Oscillospiraceae bacterium]